MRLGLVATPIAICREQSFVRCPDKNRGATFKLPALSLIKLANIRALSEAQGKSRR
jgi:hypothetical protein